MLYASEQYTYSFHSQKSQVQVLSQKLAVQNEV
jgi:hypothetical protein